MNVVSAHDPPACAGRRVLVAESGRAEAAELEDRMRQMDCELVGVVTRGEELAAAIESARPDVLLLDVWLAGEVDVGAALRAVEQAHRPSVIVVSDDSDDATLARASESEPDGHLVKPFDERLLRVTVELAIQKRRGRLAEQCRRRSERRLFTMLEYSQDGVVAIDPRGNIGIFNRRAEEIFGWSATEIVGRPLDVLLPPEHRASHPLHVDRFASSSRAGQLAANRGELVGLRKNGEVFPVEIAIAKTQFEDEAWICAHVRDLTARHRLEAQVVAAEKAAAVGRLALGVAHDFNNILTAIRVDLFVLESATEEARGGALREIDAAIKRGTALVRQVLGFARRGTGETRRLSLTRYLEEAESLVRVLLGGRSSLKLRLPQEDLTIEGEPTRLEQALVNLVVNARDAMPSGGELRLRAHRAHLDEPRATVAGTLSPGDYVVLVIEDSGVGVSDDVKEHMFEPFFTTKPEGRGTGLGLSIVESVMREHRGGIEVETRHALGTTFRLWFPEAPDGARPATDRPRSAPPAHTSARLSVLLVEDDDALRIPLALILRRAGYGVTTASEFGEALRLVEGGLSPDVLVSDVSLGGLDGGDLALRVAALVPSVSVLLLTGETSHVPGADRWDVLRKPFEVRELLARLDAAHGGDAEATRERGR